MNQFELSSRLDNLMAEHEKRSETLKFPFVFYLLGPPSVGKSFLHAALFSEWKDRKPCYVRASSFMYERSYRLANSLSECCEEAYCMGKMRSGITNIINGRELQVKRYNHKSGLFYGEKSIISTSSFIYIEGPIWLKLYDEIDPCFIVFLQPGSIEQWKNSYIYRNVHYRNYHINDARKTCALALSGWQAAIKSLPRCPDISIKVDYYGENMCPTYEIVDNQTDIGNYS